MRVFRDFLIFKLTHLGEDQIWEGVEQSKRVIRDFLII
jgi:hypothetical protein